MSTSFSSNPAAPASHFAEPRSADSSRLDLVNVRPWGGAPVDLAISEGFISAVEPHDPARPIPQDARLVDGKGLLALPGFANAHAHTDKSWWGKPWVSYGGEATTAGRIAHERAHRDELGIPGVEVSTAVMREYLRHGTTVQRTHVDVDLGVGLRGIEVVCEAVAGLDNTITTQIVAFPQDGVLRREGVLELLDAAAAAGADYIGGLDPATIDRDPVGQLDGIFRIAEKHGCGIDLHLHDGGELGAFQIELMADRTIRAGLEGKVNVAHGFAVGQLSPARQAALIERMAEAGMSMTTVSPLRVEPLPVRELLAAGVPVALGTDGFRDLWGPYGDGDMLKVALKFAQVSGLRYDEELTLALELATTVGAQFAGVASHNLSVGDRADVVLLEAENPMDALVRSPQRAVVIAGGKIVVAGGQLVR